MKHKHSGLAAGLAALLLVGAVQADDVQVSLGSSERVTRLFAYPNNCSVICYRDWTLEQTAEHYLTQSLERDGYADATVKVSQNGDILTASFSGVPADYGTPLSNLLAAGDSAFDGASKLNSDGKWQYSWYFFLPLGMALDNRKSVELLHFPPDYSLTQAQDYLESKTTDRWASLLTENGVAATETPAYQTIIDIAPIAAPASAGSDTPLPMVAFGGPVRTWVNSQYKVNIGVLGLDEITPVPGQNVPVLGANHPSYIWYAADPQNYGGDQAKADAAGLKVMGQDISAACWQAGMGQNPSADPQQTLNSCTQKWQVTDQVQTCELFYTSIRNLTPPQAQAKCTTSKS
jgi:hypothetical protein